MLPGVGKVSLIKREAVAKLPGGITAERFALLEKGVSAKDLRKILPPPPFKPKPKEVFRKLLISKKAELAPLKLVPL